MRRLIDVFRHGLTGAARWVLISAVGGTLVVAGIVMLFTPGPGLAALALGLWILSKQFRWAQRVFERLTSTLEERRDSLPTFVGRILDERARRRRIQRVADDLAEPEPEPGPEPVHPAADSTQVTAEVDVDAGNPVVTPRREPGGAA